MPMSTASAPLRRTSVKLAVADEADAAAVEGVAGVVDLVVLEEVAVVVASAVDVAVVDVVVEEVAALVPHTHAVLSNCNPGWIWSPLESFSRSTAKE